MATQQDFYNQLASIYDPQVQSIQAQQALLPAQAEAQTSALEQARTNAFKKIDNTASARGMTFSGFSPDQQATYTGATYLPALANVKLSQNQANLKLIDALNGINANRGTQAMNMYQGQQNALADAEAKRYAAELAYQSKVDSARISSSSKAPAKTSLAEMKAIDSQTLGSKMAAQAGMDLTKLGVETGFGIWSSNQARAEAAKNREFQHDMYMDFQKHRFKYTVDSLREAGLNPILAAGGGLGASGSAPSGSAGSPPPVRTGASALDTVSKIKQNQLLEAQLKNVEAMTAREWEQVHLNAAQARKATSESIFTEELTPTAKAAAKRSEEDEKFYSTDYGKWARNIGLFARELNPFLGSAHSAKSLAK